MDIGSRPCTRLRANQDAGSGHAGCEPIWMRLPGQCRFQPHPKTRSTWVCGLRMLCACYSSTRGRFLRVDLLERRYAVFEGGQMAVHKYHTSSRRQKPSEFLDAAFSGIGGAVPGWTARLTSTLR